MNHPPDLALTGGRVLTLDPSLGPADSLLISGGLIRSVGMASDLTGAIHSARDGIDLGGKTVLPGFIDTHVHMIGTGLAHFQEDLTDVRSLQEALARLKEAADRETSEGWVMAHGLAAGLLRDQPRLPSAEELNRISAAVPIFVSERTGHACSLNGAALGHLSIPAGTPGYPAKRPAGAGGVLTDRANTLAYSQTEKLFAESIGYDPVIRAATQEALRAGLTTVHALDGVEPADDQGVRSLLAQRGKGQPRLLVYYQTRQVDAVLRLGLPRIGGCVACSVDGAFTPHTACLLEPYSDQPESRGTLYFSDDEILAFFRAAHRAGLQLSLHCLGDGAVEQAIGAYEVVLHEHPRPDHRHRIEHAELITPGQIDRARRLGIAFAIQPAFNHFWRHDDFYPPRIGLERSLRVDPIRTLVQAGLLVAGGSDSTVTPLGPLLGIHSAVNHSNPAERVDVHTALELFTLNAARIGFEEKTKGSVTAGKLADLVILGANPLEVSASALKDIPIEGTLVGGEVAYWR